MDTKKLRQKILDLAIHGKLVPQDPNDEPASVLLERIRAEKEQLMREGKIKAPKKSKTAGDTSHYGKEGPWKLPEGWEWKCLAEVGTWQSGSTPSRGVSAYYGGTIPWLKTGDLNDGYITNIPEHITDKALAETSVKLNPAGSVLIAMYGATIGKMGILTFPATTNQACCACSGFNGVSNKYLFYFLLSHREAFIRQGGGGAQPNISKEIIINTPIPIPPEKEQERIVNAIEKWSNLISQVEDAEHDLHNSIDSCKAKVLELAIHGKLVHQDPNDEPAIELLKRVNPGFRPSDNLHYAGDLLKGWIRCRVSEAFEINPKVVGNDEDECAFVPMALVPDGYSNELRFEKRRWATIKKGFTRFADGDIGVAKISPCLENRKSVIFRGLPSGIGAGTTELTIFRPIIVIAEYGLLFFKSEEFVSNCKGTYNGVVGQQRVDLSEIRRMYINIPPISEQHRIVEAVEQLFHHLESIQRSNSL